jgi:outer membrane immunogenic protein
MGTSVLRVAAIVLALTTTAAFAADVPRYPPPYAPAPYAPPPPGYFWTGAYIGGNIGYQWGSVTNSPAKPSGVMGGIQAGYNYQVGQFVIGVETDIQVSAADDLFAPWKFSNPWFGTTRGRAGIALTNVLFYGTLGIAYGGGKIELAGLSETNTHFGWAAGAGLEVGLTPNWSAKAEYLYVDLAAKTYLLTGASHSFESNILRFGLNYRF